MQFEHLRKKWLYLCFYSYIITTLKLLKNIFYTWVSTRMYKFDTSIVNPSIGLYFCTLEFMLGCKNWLINCGLTLASEIKHIYTSWGWCHKSFNLPALMVFEKIFLKTNYFSMILLLSHLVKDGVCHYNKLESFSTKTGWSLSSDS